jgi:hypothetical protein
MFVGPEAAYTEKRIFLCEGGVVSTGLTVMLKGVTEYLQVNEIKVLKPIEGRSNLH